MGAEDIHTVAVIGAGLMGHGIAQEFATAGYTVRLQDVDEETLAKAVASIRDNLEMMAAAGLVEAELIDPALDGITTTTSLAEAAGEADLVIEAVSENLELKQRLFGELDGLCPPRTILASNTSSFMPSLLAQATRRPDRVLVAHYFNPPPLLPLVELVRGADTSNETLETVRELLVSIGKKPAVVAKETPGFVGNRLQAALIREAVALVEAGVATPQDVDTVIKDGFGRRLAAAGIFEVFDIAGWDLVQAIYPVLVPALQSSTEMPQILRDKVARGELGVKTGKGFHEWPPEAAADLKARIGKALMEIVRW